MKNKYRLFEIFILLQMAVISIFILNKSDIKLALAGMTREYITQTVMPAYYYMNNVDNDVEFNFKNSIVNDIYPMNEYLIANENTGNLNAKTDFDINEKNNNQNVTDNSNLANNEETEAGDKNRNKSQEEALKQQDNNLGGESHENKNNDQQVISKNVRSGNIFSREDLNNYDFIYKKFYTVTSITSLTPQILRPQEFLDKDMKISHDASTPQILIFHTHSQEGFVDSNPQDPQTTIVGVGDYLTKLLTEKYGYNVIHDTGVYDYVDGKLDRSKAYTYSEAGIKKILEENPSIDVVIDLHRDGISESTHLITNVDGRQMAKVMLFNGLSYSNKNGDIDYLYNPYRDDNLAMSLQLQLLGEAYYPDFFRHIYCNAYRYCLHTRAKSMLIEAGAQTNTVQEEKNAMEPLADLLDKLLRGEKAY